MDAEDVRTRLLAQFGIRIEPAMSRYVLRRLANGAGDGLPIMGGDARTGVPVRRVIPLAAFDAPTNPPKSLIS